MKKLSKGWRVHYQMNKISKVNLPWTNQLSHINALETVEMNKGMGKYVRISTSALCKKISRNSRFKILEITIYTSLEKSSVSTIYCEDCIFYTWNQNHMHSLFILRLTMFWSLLLCCMSASTFRWFNSKLNFMLAKVDRSPSLNITCW